MKIHRILPAFVVLAALMASATVYATQPEGHQVTICHATPPDTAAQGYVQITVDIASVGYQHSGHQDQHDADIIPPYEYGDLTFAGKNWTEAGQAIWENDCVDPDASPTPEVTPSPTPEVTPAPTPEVTPSPTPDPTPEVTPDPTPSATPSPTPELTLPPTDTE